MSKYIIVNPGKKCKNNFMGYHPAAGTVFCDKRKTKPTKPCLMEIVYHGTDKNSHPYVVAVPVHEFKTKVFHGVERLLTSNDGNCQMRVSCTLPTYEPGNEDSIVTTLKLHGEDEIGMALASELDCSDESFWVLPASCSQPLTYDDMVWVMFANGETSQVCMDWIRDQQYRMVNTTVIQDDAETDTVRFEPMFH